MSQNVNVKNPMSIDTYTYNLPDPIIITLFQFYIVSKSIQQQTGEF